MDDELTPALTPEQKLTVWEEEMDRLSLERPTYYDRDGSVITASKWGELFQIPEYKILQQTLLDNEDGIMVSTVWLGLDHGYGYGTRRPLIFETMIFGMGINGEEYQERYSTEAGAMEGHWRAVQLAEEAITNAATEVENEDA